MHQPLYVDPLTQRAEMPWVRLHGSRSYLDVARLLDEYGDVHLTVNFVPSLVLQLDAVVAGARDTYQEVATRPSWTPDDRAFLLRRFFSVHWARSVETRPRYVELLEKRGREIPPGELSRRGASFSDEELRDLTVLFYLAWLGFAAREGDREIAELERKGRGYTLADLELVLERGRVACARVLPLYRKLAERGQVELSASPYYHPIVPLLCDSNAARRAQQSLPLPERFSYPADGRLQIARGRDAHLRSFGQAPRGMWPPEGSISPEAVAAYRAEGIRWLASDEGNLWRSLDTRPPRSALYHAWQNDGVDLVFRDREISDLIGFSYAFGETPASVNDLLGRARRAATDGATADGSAGATPLVSVILDGENPWEAFPGQGEPFLRGLFSALTTAAATGGDLRAVSIAEHLAVEPHRRTLSRVHSGSWIDSDFHIWIGDPVKNRAWDLLGQARRRYERAIADGIAGETAAVALEHLLAAEGSDWFWWFGEPFQTQEKGLFDHLFRAHVAAVWRALGEAMPAELGEPVATGDTVHRLRPPRGYIHPKVEGRRTYYEWLDAGRFEVGRGSAMAETPLVATLYFGFDATHFYLRLDPAEGARPRLTLATVELLLHGNGRELRMIGSAAQSTLTLVGESARIVGKIAARDIVELAISLADIGVTPGERLELSVRLLDGGIQLGRYPADGHVAIQVPDEHFAATHWSV